MVLYRVSVHRVVIFLVESVGADLRGDVFSVLVRQSLKFVFLLVGCFFSVWSLWGGRPLS